jgi:hypothetical protein
MVHLHPISDSDLAGPAPRVSALQQEHDVACLQPKYSIKLHNGAELTITATATPAQ